MEDDKSQQPAPLSEILAEVKPKVDKPSMHRGFPMGVGSTGISMGKVKTYDREDSEDDVPSGETVGARVVHTTKVR